MTEPTHLSPGYAVRPQIRPEELAEIAARGFKGIVNARPDGEEPGQPSSAQIAAEAQRHGLGYWHIPVVPGEAGARDGDRFARAASECDGPLLGFCRSGMRAKGLWEQAGKPC